MAETYWGSGSRQPKSPAATPTLLADGSLSEIETSIGLHNMVDENSFLESDHTTNRCMAIVPVDSPRGPTCTPTELVPSSSKTVPTEFAGLINSGMTCYMNSLLQTLFMTPEFRNALFRWRFEGTPKEAVTSIPYQLQRLFVQLYTTKATAVSTTGVTTSFGWRSTDVIQQQDVHELCRVMFDALEKKLGTGQIGVSVVDGDTSLLASAAGDHSSSTQASTHNLINRLYQGKRSDCVRCMFCNRVSYTPDTFLDIQVPLRPFELDAKPYESLEAAFRALVKPERLDGSNQYFCSQCQTKRDAERSCAFHRMPYLLTLQLMRFTFDLSTLNRIKLNDRFTFPLDRWDLSEFITSPPPEQTSDDEEGEEVDECLNCASEEEDESTDYLETENEYELTSKVAGNGTLSAPIVNRLLNMGAVSGVDFGNTADDEFDEMDVANADSGVNSSTTDSPVGTGFSRSPAMRGSPNLEDDLPSNTDRDLELGNHCTITAGIPTGPALERAFASAVAKYSEMSHNDIGRRQTDHSIDTDEDDGFGTGDAHSACSSATNSWSSVNGHQSKDSALSEQHEDVNAGVLHASYCWSTANDLTPTKDRQRMMRRTVTKKVDSAKPSTEYELFSIMVHSGFINTGHYYAYIRSFSDGQWYCFNDKTVTRATQSDLEETFGSNQSSFTSRANAYFLMYRRVDRSRNEDFLRPEQFPDHIRKMIEEIRTEELETEKRRELELSVYKFDVYTRCPSTQGTIQSTISVHKNSTLAEVANTVREILLPDYKQLNSPHCRIVQFNHCANAFGKSADYTLWYKSDDITSSTQLTNGHLPIDHLSIDKPTNDAASAVCNTEPTPTPSDANHLVTIGDFAEGKRFHPFKLWLEHRLNVPGAVTSPDSSSDAPSLPPRLWRGYEPRGITVHVARVDIGQRLVYQTEKLWFSVSSVVEDLIRDAWQLFTGSTYEVPSTCDIPRNIHLIADFSHHVHRRKLPASPGFPDWVLVMSDEANRDTRLVDLFPDCVTDLSNSYNYHKPRSCHVYVDLGPYFDGVVAEPQAGESASIDRSNSDAKRGRWQLSPSAMWFGQVNGGTDTCRLRFFAAVLDEHLHCIELPVELPDPAEIHSLLLQRQLLHWNPETMDIDDVSTSLSADHVMDHRTQSQATAPVTLNSWSDWFLQPESDLKNPFSSHNQLGGESSHVSSTDSGCSVTARFGSPNLDHRSSSPLHRSPVSSPSPISRRRSSSQSYVDHMKTSQTNRPSSLTSSSRNLFVRHPAMASVELLTNPQTGSTSQMDTKSSLAIPDCCSGCIAIASAQQYRLCKFECFTSNDSFPGPSSCNGAPSFRVRLDTRLSVEQFKTSLAEYLQLDKEGVEITVCSHQQTLYDFAHLQANSKLSVTIDALPESGVLKVGLRILDLTGAFSTSLCDRSSPVWPSFFPILCRSDWNVDRILAVASSMLHSLHHLEIPRECLRLRKCGLDEPVPGPILQSTELLSTFYNPHQGLMLQLLTNKEHSSPHSDSSPIQRNNRKPRPHCGFFFVRQWHPATMTFDPAWHEVVVPSSADRRLRWNTVVDWICRNSCLTPTTLLIALCNFPGVKYSWSLEPSIGHTASVQWHSCASYDSLHSPVPTNGQVVYYKDANEVYTDAHSSDSGSPNSSAEYLTGSASLSNSNQPADFPIIGPQLPPNDCILGLPTSSSQGDIHSHTISKPTYEQPLRIYTVEEAPPSPDPIHSTHNQFTVRPVNTKESRTP